MFTAGAGPAAAPLSSPPPISEPAPAATKTRKAAPAPEPIEDNDYEIPF
jgi:hypothetical protein